MNYPGAEAQLIFLQKIQRLFSEGDFTATYKFALLMALADLSVRQGRDTGDQLALSLVDIAEEFIRYYWPQTVPYVSGAEGGQSGLLVQNNGQQAAVVKVLAGLRASGITTLADAKRHPDWSATLSVVARTVLQMPVTYLQNVAGEPDHFLFDPPRSVRAPLVLKPGIAYCLRRFHGFINELAKAAWVNHVRGNRRNQPIIGPVHELEDFMFGTPRRLLQPVAEVLRPLQGNTCFYCGGRIGSAAEVDHFISWARYPQDTAHNFVLAHRACNNDKRDLLAGCQHLDHWIERNARYGEEIAGHLGRLGFIADTDASNEVARWAYRQGLDMGAHGWVARGQTERLDRQCLALLG